MAVGINCIEGLSLQVRFNVVDGDGVAVDITGTTVSASIKIDGTVYAADSVAIEGGATSFLAKWNEGTLPDGRGYCQGSVKFSVSDHPGVQQQIVIAPTQSA